MASEEKAYRNPSEEAAEALLDRWLTDLKRSQSSTLGRYTWMDPYLRRYLLPQSVSADASWERLLTPESIAWMHPGGLTEALNLHPGLLDDVRLTTEQSTLLQGWRDLAHIWRCNLNFVTEDEQDTAANLDALRHHLAGMQYTFGAQSRRWQTLWRRSPRVTPGIFDSFQSGLQKVTFVRVADREFLASAHRDGVIRVWDAETLEAVSSLRVHRGGVGGLASVVSDDGQPLIVSGGVDRSIAVTRVTPSGPVLTNRFVHGAEVDALTTVRQDGGPQCVVVGCRSGLVLVRRLLDGRILASYNTMDSQARDFTSITRPDGSSSLWVATRHGDVIELDLSRDMEQDGRILEVTQVRVETELWALSSHMIGDDDVQVAAGGNDGRMYIWNWSGRPELESSVHAHEGGLFSIVEARDRDSFFSGGGDGLIRESNRRLGIQRPLPANGMVGRINGLAYELTSAGRPLIAAGSSASMGRVWDAATSALLGSYIDHEFYRIQAVHFSTTPQGEDSLITIGDGSQVLAWDLADGGSYGLPGPNFSDRASGLSSYWIGDRHFLVAGSYDGSLISWSTDGITSKALQRNASPVAAIVVVGGRLREPKLVSGHADGALRFWDLTSGELELMLPVADGPVISMSVPPESDSSTLVCVGCDTGAVLVVDSLKAERIHVVGGHEGTVRALATDVIGHTLWIASAADDDHVTVRTFDLTTGDSELVWSKAGFRGRVLTRLIAQDAPVLLGAGDTSEIRAWDLITGDELPPSLGLLDRPEQMNTLQTSESAFLIAGAGVALMRLEQ